jgi:hypothetical protein
MRHSLLLLLVAFFAGKATAQTELVGLDSLCSFLVPSEDNGGSELATEEWTTVWFDDSSWELGALGIGYGSQGEIWYEFLYTDVMWLMFERNPSLYLRAHFDLTEADIAQTKQLVFQARFDDGFVAHLNGTEVVRFNAPEEVAWNSRSAASYPDFSGSMPHPFDLTEHLGLLLDRDNILAIQLLNNTQGSQDAFILPELTSSHIEAGSVAHPRHLSILTIEPRGDGLPGAITVGTAIGKIYVLQQSNDLENWSDHSLGVLAASIEMRFNVGSSRTGPQYFRVVER